MRKLFALLLAVTMLVTAGVSQAVVMQSPDARMKIAVWVGEDGPTSTNSITLTSQNRIIGFTVSGSSTPAAGLYDTSAVVTASNALLIDEGIAASNSMYSIIYPAPKTITTGVTVVTNASTTVCAVYYE